MNPIETRAIDACVRYVEACNAIKKIKIASPTLRAMNHSGSHANAGGQIAIAFDARQDCVSSTELFGALGCSEPQAQAVVHAIQAGALRTNPASGCDGVGVQADISYTLEARSEVQCVQYRYVVRRILPTEAEALQGLPRGYTQVPYRGKPAADSNRYKAIGNSMAVPVMRWCDKERTSASFQVGRNAGWRED